MDNQTRQMGESPETEASRVAQTLVEQNREIERLRQQNAELADIIQTICDETGMCVSTQDVLFFPKSKWYLTTGGD